MLEVFRSYLGTYIGGYRILLGFGIFRTVNFENRLLWIIWVNNNGLLINFVIILIFKII